MGRTPSRKPVVWEQLWEGRSKGEEERCWERVNCWWADTEVSRAVLLPVSGIIVITDGVTSVPDVAVCETLLNQLRSGTVACSFVQVRIF